MDKFKLYETQDEGASWTKIKDDIEGYASIYETDEGAFLIAYYCKEDNVNKIKVIISEDRGENWEDLSTVDSGDDVLACQPEIIGNATGKLYVFYLKKLINPDSGEEETTLVYKVSLDRGETWEKDEGDEGEHNFTIIEYLGS